MHKPTRSKVLSFMNRASMLKVLIAIIHTDLVRRFADYESYSTFISFFLEYILTKDVGYEDMFELCLETIIQ